MEHMACYIYTYSVYAKHWVLYAMDSTGCYGVSITQRSILVTAGFPEANKLRVSSDWECMIVTQKKMLSQRVWGVDLAEFTPLEPLDSHCLSLLATNSNVFKRKHTGKSIVCYFLNFWLKALNAFGIFLENSTVCYTVYAFFSTVPMAILSSHQW